MGSKKSARYIAGLFALTGAAIACSQMLPLPVPPVVYPISTTEIASAMNSGFSAGNSLHAAAMRKVDNLGSGAVGDNAWRSNNFVGYVTFRGPIGGVVQVPIDKPCNTTLEQQYRETVGSTVGGGSGGGSSGGGGGGGPSGPGGCVYGCDGDDPRWGNVGEIAPV